MKPAPPRLSLWKTAGSKRSTTRRAGDDAPVIAYRGGGRLLLAQRTMDFALELRNMACVFARTTQWQVLTDKVQLD